MNTIPEPKQRISHFFLVIYTTIESSFYNIYPPCPTMQIKSQTAANKFPHSYRVKRRHSLPIHLPRFLPFRWPGIHGPGNEKGKAKGEVAIAASAPAFDSRFDSGRRKGSRAQPWLQRERQREREVERIEGCLPSIQWLDAATLRLVDSPLTEFSPKSLGKSPPGCDLHCGICTFVSERTNKQIFSPMEEKYICIYTSLCSCFSTPPILRQFIREYNDESLYRMKK